MADDAEFLDFFNALSTEEFEETPVSIEEFVTSDDYLNLPPLSDYQYQMIRNGSQIYRRETLVRLYGEEAAEKRWKETNTEVILQLGKGSGKDYTSTIVCTYVAYLLLCLKDPAAYYGKPKGDTIDIVNIAINSDQARNVFFTNLKKRISDCSWFDDKVVTDTQYSLEFKKSIRLFSGHSEREAFEGLNLFLAVLDEISGFALESATGNKLANTALATYNMYRDSVDSRFAEFGKVLLLSFPRFDGDFIQQKYDKGHPDDEFLPAVAEKEVIIRRHTFKLDNDLPDGTPGNEFEIEWEEDHIIRYARPGVWALRRPSWEVNPTVTLEGLKWSFFNNPGNALGKYACMPSNLEDGFFKNKDKIDKAFSTINGVDSDGVYHPRFQPKDGVEYFIHVDLAQKHDHCAVAMAHVDRWLEYKISDHNSEILPEVHIDALRWWTPSKGKEVDFKDVIEFIKSLRRRGFNIRVATFDRWNSNDTMKDLERNGIRTDLLSVDKKHYDDFLSIMYDERLKAPNEELVKKELGQLRTVLRGQKVAIDHPAKGSKDLSDASCGAIFNSITLTEAPHNIEVEALTLADMQRRLREEQREAAERPRIDPERPGKIIRPPDRPEVKMPPTLAAWIAEMHIFGS